VAKAEQPFDQLYDRHFEAIFRYVLRRVANVSEAEDLTAQTFYKALRSFWRFRWSGGNASAWLYRIATNEVNSYYRDQAAGRGVVSGSMTTDPNDAERDLAVSRLYLDLHRALRRLAPDDQALIVLRYFEQKPYDEITQILGGRSGTLAMRANRALKKLKHELRERGINHEAFRGILASAESARPGGRSIPAEAAP
jgi:RNA polymerase sigma-70 factor (ECF subfamily)